jgi:molecular chaperone GrpE
MEEKKNKKKKIESEIEELIKQNKELQDKVLYKEAELINYRRRKDEETSNMLKYANMGLIEELLPILDNFERAIKLDDNNLNDELSKFLQGFKMMYSSLCEILKNFGVKEIEAIGREFDPTIHEALMTDNISDIDNNIITEVLLKGYMLKDRVIRPASVKVNHKIEINENEKGEEENE